jgi:hypothetical protein
MSIPCLIFVKLLIPQHHVNYCHLWMPTQAIIKLASPLTTKKIAFITPFEIFCYTKMAFGLKNGGAMYQKCIHIILEPQIGRNIEAYIDDVLVKSKNCGHLLDDLKETFDNLCKYNMRLNPKKCVFGVSSRKLLGYMVSSWGIDVNPKKV